MVEEVLFFFKPQDITMDINLTIYDNYLTPYTLASSNILFGVDETHITFNSNANTVNATNIGGDVNSLFIDKVNDTLRFKSVDSGSFAFVSSTGSTIEIGTSFSGIATSATNGLFISNIDGLLSFQNLAAGSFIGINNTDTTITIDYTSSGGGVGNATNIGGATNGLFITNLSSVLLFKNLAMGSFITFTNNNSLIGINAAPPVGTNIVIGATNIAGSANGLYISKDANGVLLFKNIFGGSFVQLVDAGTTVSFGYTKTGTSIVTGATNLGGNVNGFYLSLATTGALNFSGFLVSNTNITVSTNNSVINISGVDSQNVTNGTNILGTTGGLFIGTISSLLMTFKNIYNGSFISIIDDGTTLFINTTEKSQTITLGTTVLVQSRFNAILSSIVSFPFQLNSQTVEYSLIPTDPADFSQRFEKSYITNITSTNFTFQSVMKNSTVTDIDTTANNTTNFSVHTVNNGYPAVAYIDSSSNNLKFAINASPYGTGFWAHSTVDTNQCLAPSLVELENGCPGISYYDFTNNNMRFASNQLPNGNGIWTTIVVDTLIDSNVEVSSVILADGRPAMAYAGTTLTQLKYARNTLTSGFGAWSSISIGTFGQTVVGLSMTLQRDNYPCMAFGTIGNLYYGSNDAFNGFGFWSFNIVNSSGNYYPFSLSLAIASGTPALAFENSPVSGTIRQLIYVRNSAVNGSGVWTTVNIANLTTINRASSLTVASDGMPCIAYAKDNVLLFTRNNSADGLGLWSSILILESFSSSFAKIGMIGQINGNLAVASIESVNNTIQYTTSQIQNTYLANDATFVVSWLGQ